MVDNRRLGSAALAAAGLLLAAAAPARAWDPAERVSVGPHGRQANGASGGRVTMSPDGRYVVFISDATNLVPRDTNGLADLFVRDRKLGTIERVNLGPNGVQGNDIIVGYGPAISDDGRYVAFVSYATNLVDGDTNGAGDVFVRDRWKGRTERVSVAGDGTQGDDFSGYGVAISGDGRYVAFGSLASNLVPNDTNDLDDVFVHDRVTGTTERVNLGSGGVQDNRGGIFDVAISDNGRYVAFESMATNFGHGGHRSSPQVFVRDRKKGVTETLSLDLGGKPANSSCFVTSMSADGRYVAFESQATDLVAHDTNGPGYDVFIRDRRTGVLEVVGAGPRGSQGSSGGKLSANGRFVLFSSDAPNLVPHDTNGFFDVFLYDRMRGTTERLNVGPGGEQSNAFISFAEAISADGRTVAFSSEASNLVDGDTNRVSDVFVRTQ